MNSLDIAQLIVNKCLEENKSINITKIHKLLYIVYGTYLVINDSPLFDERPACFQYGPIFKSLQAKYKKGEFHFQKKDVINNDDIEYIIDSAINKFGNYSAVELSEWSHREGSAWKKAFPLSDYWGNEISDEFIKEEFQKVVEQRNEE